MNILNRIRKLIKDTSDTSFSRDDKISYIKDWLEFYDKNILKYAEIELFPESDQITFKLPENYSTIVNLYVSQTIDTFSRRREEDYKLFELEDYILDEVNWELRILKDIFYTSLKLQYNKKSTWTITKTIWSITWGSNVTITLDNIDWFKKWDFILIDTVLGEEEVKIKEIDKDLKKITVDLVNDVLENSKVIWDLQVLNSDKDIVSYYSANLTYNISNWVTSGWISSKRTQWKVSYEIRTSTSTGGANVNWYMSIVEKLLKSHINYINNENSISFWQVVLV